jgi:hypothetical protein
MSKWFKQNEAVAEQSSNNAQEILPPVDRREGKPGECADEDCRRAHPHVFGEGCSLYVNSAPSNVSTLSDSVGVALDRLSNRIDSLEARIRDLENQPVAVVPAPESEQVYAVVPSQVDPVPPVNVVPPTGPLVVKGIHYKDAVCDECGQVHDGTGRVMDTRGKLIQNPKKCSQQ